jgi:hypothetical protein
MKKILTLLLAAVIFNLNAQVNFTESNLPIFVIDTYGEEIPDEDKITASLGIIYNGENQTNYLTDPFNNYNGFIGIELRGSSSQMFPKKQYGFETRDSSGEGINVSLLNFPEEEDWIINGPYSDKSLMRNALTFKLGREFGHYASRYKFVEVVINNDYKGVYLLFEKIKRDKNRVDISKLDPDEISGTDLTGGYIIKVDKWAGEDNDGWQSDFLPFENSPNKVFYQYDYPKAADIAPEQKAYIQNYIKSFETLMDSDNYGDPVSGYSRYIDVNSFVDFFIIQEVTKNVDAYRLSSFMYKDKSDKDSLLHMGPIWDFNLAFGNANYYEAFNIDGWILEYLTSNSDFLYGDQFQVPFWWKKLFNDENFRSNVRERYINLRDNILSSANMLGFIDSVYTLLDNAQERNFERWPVLGTYVWPNYFIGNSYFAEVNYMKSWINYRLSWLDNNMFGGPVSVSDEIELKPNYFYLSQNYPNPFNPTTSIEYSIPAITNVTIRVYDILGNEIATLVNESKEPGNYKVNFDASELSSGVYFYKLQAGSFIQTKKLILVK